MPRLRWHPRLTLVAALLVWATLVLRLYLGAAEAQDQNPLLAALNSFSHFTVLTTLLAALALSAALGADASGFFRRADVNTLIAASVLLVAIVYSVMLRSLWDPQGLRKLVDVLLHDVIPLLFLVYWWLAIPKVALHWRQIALWLLYPLGYLFAILVKGALTGAYPYPFIDAEQLGYGRVALNALGLLALFAVLAACLVALTRWQAGPPRGSPVVEIRKP